MLCLYVAASSFVWRRVKGISHLPLKSAFSEDEGDVSLSHYSRPLRRMKMTTTILPLTRVAFLNKRIENPKRSGG